MTDDGAITEMSVLTIFQQAQSTHAENSHQDTELRVQVRYVGKHDPRNPRNSAKCLRVVKFLDKLSRNFPGMEIQEYPGK